MPGFAQTYTLDDVVRLYSARELTHAKAYLNSISQLDVQANSITASVRGTAIKPYQVKIVFMPQGGSGFMVSLRCSCPVQVACKHTAAVMLSALSATVSTRVNPQLLSWVESFQSLRLDDEADSKPAKTSSKVEKLCFVLSPAEFEHQYVWNLFRAKFDGGGLVGGLTEWVCRDVSFIKPPKFVTDEDLSVLRLLWQQRNRYDGFSFEGEGAHEILLRLLDSGQAFYQARSHAPLVPLKKSNTRPAQLVWGADSNGRKRLQLRCETPIEVLALPQQTWYLDTNNGELGALKLKQTPKQVLYLLRMPALNEVDLPVVSQVLAEKVPNLPTPDSQKLRVLPDPITPVLQLSTSEPVWMPRFRDYAYGKYPVDVARLSFAYGEAKLDADYPGEFFTLPTGETIKVKRDKKAEARYGKELEKLGFQVLPSSGWTGEMARLPTYVLASEAVWPSFMSEVSPRLREQGWLIDIEPNFRHHLLQVESWEADFSEQEDGWFSLNMGIVVNGQRLALAPLLYSLFSSDDRWLDAKQLERLADDETVLLSLPEGGKIAVPAERIKPLARTLIELFDGKQIGNEIRLSRYDLARINELTDMQRWQFKGVDAVSQLAQKLKNTQGIQPVATPEGFQLQLRPYQQEGLAWLQYLREQELSGILADDMGLGKTAQTLAHLLHEKNCGRMDKPSLVVLPTSLIFNWKREAATFAPQLKVLSLHGKERLSHFAAMAEHDVVLTTYPLLWRDEELLTGYQYHYLILDEAQTIKNTSSQAAQVVRKLDARHRLCLTGTPMENHLGELWAQFDFLLPGFLGDAKQFTQVWRNPIEKQGNILRRDLLAKRVKPFILRRRKEDVAQELPPKTQIIRTVELEGRQRDLYETVRIAMDEKVRQEIASKGFSRSQIVILDALLKLRQVCCDPRLVKLASASKVKERAKLDLLMEMLPELVEEGRRILLFSQFTSMLDLIADELNQAKLGFVKLVGDTQNREEVVRRFQDGEVPIFLISLKAGGVGLNLNMADTVIHYDPWWNPAVENQATDRAHRLGQTKNVFVYKLVVAGSIEEKILALQEKKAELAAGILSEDSSGLSKFGESDLAALLEPLPKED